MKTIRNSLLTIFLIYLLSFLTANDSVISAEIPNSEVSAKRNQELPVLLVKKSEDTVIYKKDIIIRFDELKAEPKKDTDAEEFKPLVKKQEAPSLDIVDKYLKEGKKYEARNILSDLFVNKIIPEKQKEVKELLDKLNEELIFSSLPSADATMYTVQAGDVMARIAKQLNTNYELIIRINNKSPTRLNIGDKLKILTGKTKILISKSDFTLTLSLNDHYVKQYRIGIGKNDKTPVGTFEVKNKMKNLHGIHLMVVYSHMDILKIFLALDGSVLKINQTCTVMGFTVQRYLNRSALLHPMVVLEW